MRRGVGTVGLIENRPNSRNVVPGEVFFCVDLRHPDGAVLDSMEAEFNAALTEICEPLGLGVAMQKIWDQPAVRFRCRTASPRCGAAPSCPASRARDMVSGAGHDAAYISRVAPTAMIFVPCRGGISHNEAEFTSKEQCAAGAQVLLQAVLDYDRQLAERGRAALMDLFVFLAVLFAAACHAGWNASIKRTLDPLATTVLIALGAGAGRAGVRAVRRHCRRRRRGRG